MKKLILGLVAFSFALTGCSQEESSTIQVQEDQTVSSNTQLQTTQVSSVNLEAFEFSADDEFSNKDYEIGNIFDDEYDIILSDSGSSSTCSSVSISGSIITIKDEGTYNVSGSLSDGQILIEAEETDQVQLILDGVTIANSTSATINVVTADKLFITTESGSVNSLISTIVDDTDSNVDAVIFSKVNVTLNGEGSLTIIGSNANGITSKDDLKVTSGTYIINAEKHGLEANDSIRISNGNFEITSLKDGMHCENDEDSEKGYVYIIGGTFNINAFYDGIDASSVIYIENGTFDIVAGTGSADAVMQATSNNMGGMMGGRSPGQMGTTTTTTTEDEEASQKAIKADQAIIIIDGSFNIDSYDDAIHSNNQVSIIGGDFYIQTGDDGVHGDILVEISGGDINLAYCFEGIESHAIYISGGNINIYGFDDAINVTNSGLTNDEVAIYISGGTIIANVSEEGDGVDSNGNIYMSGGYVLISSTTDTRDTALDYQSYGEITGGTFISSGSLSATRQNFGTSSTQGSILQDFSSVQTGAVTLTDSSGTVIMEFTPVKEYQSVLISTADIVVGETYTITGGTETYEFVMDSLIYSTNSSGSTSSRTNTQTTTINDRTNTQTTIPDQTTMPDMQGGVQDQMTMPDMQGGMQDQTTMPGMTGDVQAGQTMPDMQSGMQGGMSAGRR